MNEIRFIDLFAGIGGFRYGLEKVGTFQRQKKCHNLQQGGDSTDFNDCNPIRKKQKGESVHPQDLDRRFICVWSNEWDKYARKIYEKHFGECDPRNIRTVDPSEIPDFDFLCAGFPCQSFSIAGKREGFADTRGTLFFDICRILRAKRPSYCLLENVKGLLSHNEGKTFKVILESLAELGYDCQWQVLNSKYFGVPQNRERVFIIGHLREKPRPEVFPIIETGSAYLESIVSTAIDSNYHKGWLDHGQRQMIFEYGIVSTKKWLEDGKELSRNFPQGQRVYNPEGISAQINSQGGGWGAKTGLYLTETMKIRRLTPLECERLQGFPDGWTEGISDTQRYKSLGNAVTVNVIEWLGRGFLESSNP